MKRTLLCALAALACACSSESQRDGKIVEVFSKHSMELHDGAELASELRSRGPGALKLFDPYAMLVGGPSEEKPAQRPVVRRPATGLLLGPCGDGACVLRVLRGSPAAKAGFKDYDRIVSAGGGDAGPGAVLSALESGAAELTVSRAGSRKKLAVSPAVFSTPSVFGLYDPATRSAYIRVGLFMPGSADAVEKGLASLSAAGPRRIVLDLRYNRGGHPQEAAAVFRLLAGKGKKCFSLKSRHPGYSVSFPPGSGGAYSGTELALLVNGETALAAEALAAALKGSGARLYGSRTKGAATISRTFALDDQSGLRLAVARFLSPSGAELEGEGVAPDEAAEAPEGFEDLWRAPAEALFFRDPAWKAAVEGAGPMSAS